MLFATLLTPDSFAFSEHSAFLHMVLLNPVDILLRHFEMLFLFLVM